MFEGKKILITGGTGSLGQALTKKLLKKNVNTVRIFSRNENKQVKMDEELDDDRLRFLIGDIRDLPRLETALEGIDIVFHAAALKHVPVIEYNPFEAIKTNIYGSQNVIDASLKNDVEIAVGIGTDKAVSPLNTYGATKLLAEKLFVTAMNYTDKAKHKTKFLALRYGNVLGSSGSVVPKFIKQIQSKKKITITDPKMTRYSLTMDEALEFVLDSTQSSKGSEIFVPKLRAYGIMDLKQALTELLGETEEENISIRPGEKLHEYLINEDEVRYTWELGDKMMIFSPNMKDEIIIKNYPGIKKLNSTKPYSSGFAEKMSVKELKEILQKTVLANSSDYEF
jgi:UDP-N-acetylglucosamine 4,6-dehydratase/5-epimerase